MPAKRYWEESEGRAGLTRSAWTATRRLVKYAARPANSIRSTKTIFRRSRQPTVADGYAEREHLSRVVTFRRAARRGSNGNDSRRERGPRRRDLPRDGDRNSIRRREVVEELVAGRRRDADSGNFGAAPTPHERPAAARRRGRLQPRRPDDDAVPARPVLIARALSRQR